MKKYNFRNESVILIGDTHDLVKTREILNSGKIPQGSDIIHMGDGGIGFDKNQLHKHTLTELDYFARICSKNNYNLYIIRGNHDSTDDKFWNLHLPYIFFIKNAAHGIFPNFKRAIMVGGGISLDRCKRKKDVDWWEDEKTQAIEKYPDKCEVMFSHDTCEHFNNPTSSLLTAYEFYTKQDSKLMQDCADQRQVMSDIALNTGVTEIFYGHFHKYLKEQKENVYAQCIAMNELFEYNSTKKYTL